MAIKAALAAALAWLVVLPIGGVANDYPYYAPFGAVIAMSATVAKSWRTSVQAIAGIMVGAALALGAARLPIAPVLELAIVVGGGILVAGWARLGAGGEWVPLAGVFVLIIGDTDRLGFVMAYVGLTALGAVIGIGLNVLWPPLPLIAADDALGRLRETLAEQLDALADGLSQDAPLERADWQQFRRAVGQRTEEMRDRAAEASEARWANWRAMRWRDESDRQKRTARALDRLALAVEDLTMLVLDSEHADREAVPLRPALREPAVEALRSTAVLVREGVGSKSDRIDAASEAVQRLASAVVDVHTEGEPDLFDAGAIVRSLRDMIDWCRFDGAGAS
jgi:uncharacterized membrane protein YgaE (UPF0421/DUF939 family)